MKLASLFIRQKPRRRPATQPMPEFTPREWADLPVHHPRQD